jgi:hypothetical protein
VTYDEMDPYVWTTLRGTTTHADRECWHFYRKDETGRRVGRGPHRSFGGQPTRRWCPDLGVATASHRADQH